MSLFKACLKFPIQGNKKITETEPEQHSRQSSWDQLARICQLLTGCGVFNEGKHHMRYRCQMQKTSSHLTAQRCALSVSASLYVAAAPVAGGEQTGLTSQIRFGSLILSCTRSIQDCDSGSELPVVVEEIYLRRCRVLILRWEEKRGGL